MSYLIVLLAVGVVLGPLMAVLPSKRQRYLAAQREYASAQGLAVRLRQLPEIPARFRFEAPPELMCYEVAMDPRKPLARQPGLFVRLPGGWESRDHDRLVPEALTCLPAGALVVSVGWDAIRVFWDEQGGEAAIDQIRAVLGELRGTD